VVPCKHPPTSGAILIKKTGDSGNKMFKGSWDSIHVVEIQEKVCNSVHACEECIHLVHYTHYNVY